VGFGDLDVFDSEGADLVSLFDSDFDSDLDSVFDSLFASDFDSAFDSPPPEESLAPLFSLDLVSPVGCRCAFLP
jgi:hypothetical protein